MEEMHVDTPETPVIETPAEATAASVTVTFEDQPRPVTPPREPAPLRDKILACAYVVLCYLLWTYPIYKTPILGLVYGAALFGFTLWHFRGRVGLRTAVLWGMAGAFLLAHFLTDNGPIRFFARWAAVLLWGYGVLSSTGNSQEARLGDMFAPEMLKANVIMPFTKLGAFFTTLFGGTRRNYAKTALMILLGFGLALLPLLLVVELLQYDESFSNLLEKLFSEDLAERIARHLLYLVLAVAMAALLMSALFGGKEHRAARVFSRDRWAAHRIRRRFLPLVASAAMLLPLFIVYGLFFFSQWPLYTSAFTGVLPQGYTYADYARKGFFELCGVCAVNGGVYLFVDLFTKRDRGEGVRRGLLTALCLTSLVLAATAFSKMVLYIRTYGLTPNRVYSSWAMILLVAAFLLALVGAYWKKLNLPRALVTLCLVMFGLLCVGNTDGFIASYNVRAYEQGRLDAVDMDMFWDLGDAAVPAAARLVDDARYKDKAQTFLMYQGHKSFWTALAHGVPGLRARALCASYWKEPAVVRVRILTDGPITGLTCYYGNDGSGSTAQREGEETEVLTPGQEVVFTLEQPMAEDWGYFSQWRTQDIAFRLWVETEGSTSKYTMNWWRFSYGDEITVTLMGSGTKGYKIASGR